MFLLNVSMHPIGGKIGPAAHVLAVCRQGKPMPAVRIDVHFKRNAVIAKPLTKHQGVLDVDNLIV